MSEPQVVALSQRLFSFLSLEHPNNNVHNMRLCRQLVAAGVVGGQEMGAMQVVEQVGGAEGAWAEQGGGTQEEVWKGL